MQLEEFFDYKNQLMEDILTNKNIVRLIDENTPFEQAEKLKYRNVFPCEYVPDTMQEGLTYVCFDVDVQESVNKTYLLPTLLVWVFTHRSKLRLPEGGVRTDAMCNEICKAINGSRFYGLGELNLHAVKRFAPATDYQGKCMIFYATDINRFYDPNKQTPKNRRNGE